MNAFSLRRLGLAGFALVALGVASAGLAGCGYSLAGRGSFLPPHIKRIGVPTFVNSTGRFEVEQIITAKVIAELIGRGKYEIVQQTEGVDAVLKGELISLTAAPAAFTSQTRASRYMITITAKIEFVDMVSNKVLWENAGMTFQDEYDVTSEIANPASFFDQETNAIERIATNFARSLISAILEAF